MTDDDIDIPSTGEIIGYLRQSDEWLLHDRGTLSTQAALLGAPHPQVIDEVDEASPLELLAQMAGRMASTTVESLIEEVRCG